ncbi:TorD/DmsD family molecular chaperone [Providencia heimbachae]|uniref:TorD/DmsD family molecular chaperone n=1 Tax=Providencia heimbachae TaxID=333962 RepID=UPI0008383D24|nr:molecular chaperone [Providencia heimbachae]NIH22388.1 molecular chaperone [Providencia heimbachae]
MIDTTLIRILGACFYYSPQTETLQNLLPVLCDIPALHQWEDSEQLQQSCISLSQTKANDIVYDYSILFEGQGAMPAPPWSSVYLEHDNTVMGESTAAYRHFLMEKGLVTETGVREPEDQFGLMLMAISALAEQGEDEAIIILLEQHLLPWSYRYLELVQQSKTEQPFYPNLAMVAEKYLRSLQQQLDLSPVKAELYR